MYDYNEIQWNCNTYIHNYMSLQPFCQDNDLAPHTTYVTYIIGHCNPSVRIINLVSHTTYVVCVIFLYISGAIYSLKSIPNDKFLLRNFSRQFYLLPEFLLEICWEEIAEKILFRISVLISGLWGSNPGFSSNKPTHYLLDHGDFHLCYAR